MRLTKNYFKLVCTIKYSQLLRLNVLIRKKIITIDINGIISDRLSVYVRPHDCEKPY